jgi:UDP-N-acetylglucosamine diphosphorylase/glucosamine-1-phosphate N-acetyltransferase
MRICVFEDEGAAYLEPLSLTRPVFELRCGAATLLERQLRLAAGRPAAVWVRPHLEAVCRLTHPELPVNDPVPGCRVESREGPAPESVTFINGRWLPPAGPWVPPGAAEVGLVSGEVAYVAAPAGAVSGLTLPDLVRRLPEWREGLPQRQAGGRMIDYPWDLVEAHPLALEQDYLHWQARRERRGRLDGVAVIGPPERAVVDPLARVEPLAALDTTRGPVLIDRGAVVQAFSRVEGPCYVGPGTQLLGARVRGASFGPECRVGGEVEASLLHGHTNKAHEGFLGHAYLGEWINLGAGTTNSDLRNDYAPVSVYLRGKRVETGLLKAGLFMGDHTKTSIGTLFNTGTVVGPFGMLVASGSLAPKVLPPFCEYVHGRVQERATLREMFATAAVMMSRRGREWTAGHAELFLEVYEQTAAGRRRLIQETELRRLRRIG